MKRYDLLYDDFINKVGSKFSIVEGELVESPSGLFTVSTQPAPYTIFLGINKKVNIITSKDSYIGRAYTRKQHGEYTTLANDCIRLFTEYHDKNVGTNFLEVYRFLNPRDYVEIARKGMSTWFIDNNFTEVNIENRSKNDCVVYSYDNKSILHVGVLVDKDLLLHHIPDKLSCIDILVLSKVKGVFRYAG